MEIEGARIIESRQILEIIKSPMIKAEVANRVPRRIKKEQVVVVNL